MFLKYRAPKARRIKIYRALKALVILKTFDEILKHSEKYVRVDLWHVNEPLNIDLHLEDITFVLKSHYIYESKRFV